jgi:hypothetical protein
MPEISVLRMQRPKEYQSRPARAVHSKTIAQKFKADVGENGKASTDYLQA